MNRSKIIAVSTLFSASASFAHAEGGADHFAQMHHLAPWLLLAVAGLAGFVWFKATSK